MVYYEQSCSYDYRIAWGPGTRTLTRKSAAASLRQQQGVTHEEMITTPTIQGTAASITHTAGKVIGEEGNIATLNSTASNGKFEPGSITLLKTAEFEINPSEFSLTVKLHIGGFEMHVGAGVTGTTTFGGSSTDKNGSKVGDDLKIKLNKVPVVVPVSEGSPIPIPIP